MSALLGWFIVFSFAIGLKIYTLIVKSSEKCISTKKMNGKTVLITGGNSGIGYQIAKNLAIRGARVIITSENETDCIRARNQLIEETGNQNIVAKYLDYRSLAVTRAFAKDILETEDRLDVLVNNAGTVGLGNNYSKDGILLGLQINYFGPFLLTHLLIGLLKKSTPSRIVNIASSFAQYSLFRDINDINRCPGPYFSDTLIYNNSKLFVVYMTWAFADKLKGTDVTVNCVSPGFVNTDIFQKKKMHNLLTMFVKDLYFKSPEQGAQTAIHLAVADGVFGITGRYFEACRAHRPFIRKDLAKIKAVWDKSIELVKLTPEEMQL